MTDQRFAGRVAVVTGGAGAIGEATVARLAREGAAVVVADLNAAGAERVAAELTAAGGRVVAQACDVSNESEIAACVQRAVDEFGRLDIMCNNAAATSREDMAKDPKVADSEVEYYEHIFRVNLLSVVLGCKYAIPHMVEQGGGAIINTSSGAALGSRPQGGSAYAASKAAVESITRSVAVQYGKEGIRCNGIAPGITPHQHAHTIISPEMFEVMAWSTQSPRLATPDQQAAVIVFLASDDASYLNGHTLPVDAGAQVITTTNALMRYANAIGQLGEFSFGQDVSPSPERS